MLKRGSASESDFMRAYHPQYSAFGGKNLKKPIVVSGKKFKQQPTGSAHLDGYHGCVAFSLLNFGSPLHREEGIA